MKVLIPIDGPELVDEIVTTLANRTLPYDAQIRLFHVVEYQPDELTSVVASEVTVFIDRETDRVKTVLQTAADKIRSHFPGCSIETKICKGASATHTIVAEAGSWPADLVVLGSHGRKGVAKLVLGSVARAVATRVTCAVMLVKAKEQAPKQVTKKDKTPKVDSRPIRI